MQIMRSSNSIISGLLLAMVVPLVVEGFAPTRHIATSGRGRLLFPPSWTCKTALVTTTGTAQHHNLPTTGVSSLHLSTSRSSSSSSSSSDSSSSNEKDSNHKHPLEKELEDLQNQWTYIEALEERNKAQVDSFVDEQDQWDSMDEEDRALLQSKDDILKSLDILAEELVQVWMGGKMMDG